MSDASARLQIDAGFDEIEAAVMETARGRRFLAEHARRIRAEESDRLLQAIAQLAASPAASPERHERALRDALGEMHRAILRARAEIGADLPEAGDVADAFDGIGHGLDAASAAILDAAGHIHEASWRLRESGADPVLCGELEQDATAIYAACAAHRRGLEGTLRVVQTIRFLEERIGAMLQRRAPPASPRHVAPDIPVPPAPRREPAIPIAAPVRAAAAREPPPAAPEAVSPSPPEPQPRSARRGIAERMAALAKIDALDTREKLRRFT